MQTFLQLQLFKVHYRCPWSSKAVPCLLPISHTITDSSKLPENSKLLSTSQARLLTLPVQNMHWQFRYINFQNCIKSICIGLICAKLQIFYSIHFTTTIHNDIKHVWTRKWTNMYKWKDIPQKSEYHRSLNSSYFKNNIITKRDTL